MTYCVGLTGNIASGKTLVSQLFAHYKITIFNADKVAKMLTNKNQSAYLKIVEHFGLSILLPDGELNRRQLREIIFSQPNEKKWLENLLHPLIRNELQNSIISSQSPYCIVEIPLLLDRETYPYINRILLVTASVGIQISRVMQRDLCTKEQAEAILATQPKMDQRIQIADDILNNDHGIDELRHEVKKLHHQYLVKAKKHRSIQHYSEK